MAMALLAICLPGEAQKFLDIYKNGNVVSSVKAAYVDSMVVNESPDNRYVYFFHDGKAFHHTQTANIDSVKVYDLAKEPLAYLGIIGFNQKLYEKPFGILYNKKVQTYKSFVHRLTLKNGTLLYYAVDHALDMLQSQSFPSQVGSVNLITFTDGLDQGSLMMNGDYTTDQQYLDEVSKRISEMKIKNLPLTAYSLGLRGSDVTDYELFQNNLKKLASSPDKAFEVRNMSAVREGLQNISDQIISISTKQTISLKIPGQSNGTLIRFTFDGSSAANSSMYIEGTFNLSNRSLRNVTYYGLRAENGETVQGKQDGIFVTFTFTGLQLADGNGLIPTSNIRHYYKSPSSSNWQENSEFTPANNTQTSVTYSGAVILFVLDCSSSLGSQFSDMKDYVNDFIDRVANYAAVDVERPFGYVEYNGGMSYFTCPDDHHPHPIDLGLPSGTKWACCNVDTDHPENQSPTNYGGYYSWGETVTKNSYSTYKSESLGSDIAGTQYDVAHVKLGGSWVMPTEEQQDELINNCIYEWTTVDAVNGGKFTSKINYNSIFLPAAGVRDNAGIHDARERGAYWSSTQDPSRANNAAEMFFSRDMTDWNYGMRFYGLSVRPVTCNSLDLELSTYSLTLNEGEENIVSITFGSGSYSIENSDISVATASLSGSSVKVTAVAAGTTTVTVTDLRSGQTATIEVTVKVVPTPIPYLTCPDDHHPHLIDLGLPSGTKWACCNVDTDHPENQSPTNYGGYYAWGETETKSTYNRSTYKYYNNGDYVSLGSDIGGTKYDVAHVKWGDPWVMPTEELLAELKNNCTFTWTTQNNVIGCEFTGPSGGSIFLPAAGDRQNSNLNYVGFRGYCWSSTQDPSRAYNAIDMFFTSSGTGWDLYPRYYGRNVRPVVRY